MDIINGNEDFADVCGAFDIAFQEELLYMVENDMKFPPMMEELFGVVMDEKLNPPPIEDIYPPIEEEPEEEEVIPPPPPPPPVKEPAFSDVAEDFWGYPHILSLYEKGILNGYGEKTMRPMAKVTRAELAKTVCKAFLNEAYRERTPYNDVPDGVWYKSYVETCSYFSIFSDIRKETFAGDEFVTRQEMCAVIYRAYLKSGKSLNVFAKYQFSDIGTLAPYGIEAAEKLQGAGIINGYGDYKFHPFNETTRSEMCKVINMLLLKR